MADTDHHVVPEGAGVAPAVLPGPGAQDVVLS